MPGSRPCAEALPDEHAPGAGAIELPPGVMADVRRIEELWRTCRDAHGGDGPFLFGRFTNADAMFAPVVNRFEVYAIEVSEPSRAIWRR
jgi:glutathione S-transferase